MSLDARCSDKIYLSVIRIAVDDIVLYGRATQGVIIMKVHGKDEKVVSITRVKSEENENDP